MQEHLPINPGRSSLQDDGASAVWRPYTQMKTAARPIEAVSTLGSRITLADGRVLIDGVASWWTACHGYNHPHIKDALLRQLEQMPHIMFGGFTHAPAERLAKRLAQLMPGDLNHVFFVDSGSIAVEVSLKMATQYWLNKGQGGKTRFVHFRGGYHGDTMACMSVCDPDDSMHAHFKGWLPEQHLADLPDTEQRADDLRRLLLNQKDAIAAVIIEPLVQGAGGMRFHAPETLRQIAAVCREAGTLLIVDEVFTGFGRTGAMTCCEAAGIVPDILCLGKALTGGALTLAATLARDHVFEAFLSDDPSFALMHGPTYMANPLACAAANASLDLFEREPRLTDVRTIFENLREGLAPCQGLKGVQDVRVLGAIGVVQLDEKPDTALLRAAFIDRGTFIRPFGDVIYLTPAFTIDPQDLKQLTATITDVVKARIGFRG